MLVIQATNVNDAYSEALFKMGVFGVLRESRNGKVMACPTPVTTVYQRPTQRMLFDAKRDANPFFHIFESIWMLAGRFDVKWIEQFNPRMVEYSDDGKTFHGAYGYRWRGYFGMDQLAFVIEELKEEPNSRRAVVSMWDPVGDSYRVMTEGKDVPCNTTIYFSAQTGELNMTVCNRSNDIIWGAYGANAVHMSMLQEFVANAVGLPVGKYYQVSNDWHIYEKHFDLVGAIPDDYVSYPEGHRPLTSPGEWEGDLAEFEEWTHEPTKKFTNPYITYVLKPMLGAYWAYKNRDKQGALYVAGTIADEAVSLACTRWLERRKWE